MNAVHRDSRSNIKLIVDKNRYDSEGTYGEGSELGAILAS